MRFKFHNKISRKRVKLVCFAHLKYIQYCQPLHGQNLKAPVNEVAQQKLRSNWFLIPTWWSLFLCTTLLFSRSLKIFLPCRYSRTSAPYKCCRPVSLVFSLGDSLAIYSATVLVIIFLVMFIFPALRKILVFPLVVRAVWTDNLALSKGSMVWLTCFNITRQSIDGSPPAFLLFFKLRLPYSLSGVFSYQLLTLLIRVGYPQTYISMESL